MSVKVKLMATKREDQAAEAVLAVGQRDALAAVLPRPAGVARALTGLLARPVHATLAAYG